MKTYTQARVSNFVNRIRTMTLQEIEDFRQKISMSTASELDKEILYTECDKRETFLLKERGSAIKVVNGDLDDVLKFNHVATGVI